jgi:hypothetical protein
MQRGNLDDLLAFLAVGRERSFTRAAAKLGMSQSSLSHTIRELEARLGVRLLTEPHAASRPRKRANACCRTLALAEEIDANCCRAIFAKTPALSDHGHGVRGRCDPPQACEALREHPDIGSRSS